MTTSTDVEPATTPSPEPVRVRRPFDVKLFIASVAIAIGVGLIGWGVMSGQTGDQVTQLPDAIESISPVPDAVQVPSQTNIVVDLAPGYTGRLVIDGTSYPTFDPDALRAPNDATPAAPGSQVDIPAGVVYDRGRSTLTFTPGEDVGFTEFPLGSHTVTVVYWRLVDALDGQEPESPELVFQYSWTFNIV